MKNKFWLFQIPIILLATAAYVVSEAGSMGRLPNEFAREKVYPGLRTFSSFFTDIKFKVRGPIPPKNNIVIVEVDSTSIDHIGRWPWHRDAIAELVDRTFGLGAKTVGLDIVFSENDTRVSTNIREFLAQKGAQESEIKRFETDFVLETAIAIHNKKLILGYTSETECLPLYQHKEFCKDQSDPKCVEALQNDGCPVNYTAALETIPQGYDKYAFNHINAPATGFDSERTPLNTFVTLLPNIDIFNAPASHAGYFNGKLDPDGVIRRTNLFTLIAGKPYPSIALAMARVGLDEELEIKYTPDHRVESMGFAKSKRTIPVNEAGIAEINFRGPERTFTYISAMDIFSDESPEFKISTDRRLASVKKTDILKDAYVFIGVSALGAFDMRTFPFGPNTPGVEGHANILDNLLSNDFLNVGATSWGSVVMLILMTVGAVAFGYATQRMESIPALLLFVGVFAGLGFVDTQVLFKNNFNWNTGYLAVELFSIFVFTLAMKYILEENNKKFLKSAFTKYVSPAIVDSIIKDPTKLSLGGERRELSIMFSDIRSFTTFSEAMDAKSLAAFLNDYLGIMTKIVFDHDGTLDKYIGDAVMAFWGAPVTDTKHSHKALLAAQAMMKALYANRERWKTQWNVTVDIGIGINTGNVSVGNMGSPTNFEYTVIGDHVNLASRLEGLTKAYGVSILTSRFTFDSIRDSAKEKEPSHRILDFVKVKGKKKAIELLQLLDRDMNPEGLKLWEEGRQLYSTQKWDDAIAKFEAANKLLAMSAEKPDGPCIEFIQRCNDFKASPPGDEWDGSWEMHSK